MRNHKEHEISPFNSEDDLAITLEDAEILSKLSKTAFKLFLFIKENSFREDGTIFFDKPEAKRICGFKQDKSVYNGLNELVDLEILAGMKDSKEFYYNPKYINSENE
jgi:hypothetical protein